MITFEDFYRQFINADTHQQKEELTGILKSQGYSFINEWIIQLEKEIKWLEEKDLSRLQELLRKAEDILPEPEQHSPLWRNLWREIKLILIYKMRVFVKVEESERDGEWQVILENPASNEGLTTHAHLTFSEAAYLYAKFRKDLAVKEHISLQRVKTFIAENGHLGPSL
jgi:hypothetical protein